MAEDQGISMNGPQGMELALTFGHGILEPRALSKDIKGLYH
jgi:hypothetical protein